MRKLIVAEHFSMDGTIQGPGAPQEDTSGNFRLGGWQVPYSDEVISKAIMDLFSHPFDLLLGRHTYDIWAGFWPQEGIKSPDNPIASKFNSATKYVATHRPDTLNWQTSHALKGELAEAVRALKHTDGPNLLTWGSSNMLHQLFAAGLVDELLLLIYPVVIGSGKRLFDDNAQATTFTLAHSVGSPSGVVIARYVRKGELRP